MSLGPNNGGFGSGNSNNTVSTFSGSGGNGGNGNGGNNNNRPRRRRQNDNPFTGGGSDVGIGISADGVTINGAPFAPGDDTPISSIFTDAGSQASGDDKAYQETAWGLFNEGGVSNDTGFAGNQVAFTNQVIDDLHQLWEGDQALEGENRLPWDQWLYRRAGTPLAPGQTPDPAFVQNTFGPAMRQMLTRMYQSATPAARGVDSRQWTAPRRLIQF